MRGESLGEKHRIGRGHYTNPTQKEWEGFSAWLCDDFIGKDYRTEKKTVKTCENWQHKNQIMLNVQALFDKNWLSNNNWELTL